jgi:hypothetical protein
MLDVQGKNRMSLINLSQTTNWAAIAVRTGENREILTWMSNNSANKDGRALKFKEIEFKKLLADLKSGSDKISVSHLLHKFIDKDVTSSAKNAEHIEFCEIILNSDDNAPSLSDNGDSIIGNYIDDRLSDSVNYSIKVLQTQINPNYQKVELSKPSMFVRVKALLGLK